MQFKETIRNLFSPQNIQRGIAKAEPGHSLTMANYKATDKYDTGANIAFLTCVKILAEMLSAQEIKLFDAQDKIVMSDELTYLLRRPNRWQTWQDFILYCEKSRVLKGDAVVYIKWSEDYTRIEELVPLDVQYIKMYVDDVKAMDLGSDIVYEYRNPNTQESFTLGSDDVLHFKFMPTMYRGTPAGNALANTIRDSATASSSLRANADAGYNGVMVLTLASDLNTARRAEVANDLKQTMNNAHGAAMLSLPPGITAQMFQNYISVSDWNAIKKASNQDVAAFFGIPAFLLTSEAGGGYGASSTAYNAFYHTTLLPILKTYCSELTVKLLTRKQIRTGKRFNVDNNGGLDLLDAEKRVSAYCQLKNSGLLTTNEIRASFAYPPVKDGDTLATAAHIAGSFSQTKEQLSDET